MAAVAACAAWNMAKWSDMKTYVEFLPEDTVNGSFYRAVLEIHQNNFDASQAFIDRTRELLDPELRAQAGESYTRAYKAVRPCLATHFFYFAGTNARAHAGGTRAASVRDGGAHGLQEDASGRGQGQPASPAQHLD